VSFAAITLRVASRRVFTVVYFVIDSVRKLLDTPSYIYLLHIRDSSVGIASGLRTGQSGF
jgi:hypothetical protein